VQKGSANMWKENIMDDLESRDLKFPKVREFLTELKREFSSRRDNKLAYQMWFTLGVKVYRIGSEMQTCGITLASAYVLHYLSVVWLQFQVGGRSPRWKQVLIGMSPLNIRN